jgi:surface antigen
MLIDQDVIRHATDLLEESLHRHVAVVENVWEVNKTGRICISEVNDYSCGESHGSVISQFGFRVSPLA